MAVNSIDRRHIVGVNKQSFEKLPSKKSRKLSLKSKGMFALSAATAAAGIFSANTAHAANSTWNGASGTAGNGNWGNSAN